MAVTNLGESARPGRPQPRLPPELLPPRGRAQLRATIACCHTRTLTLSGSFGRFRPSLHYIKSMIFHQ